VRAVRVGVAAIVCVLVFRGGGTRAGPGPADVDVDALMAQGHAALGKKEYRQAEFAFEQAYCASPDLLGALYQSAEAYDKQGDDRAAFLAYREFTNAVDARATRHDIPTELVAQRRTAEKRIKSLGRETLELEKAIAKQVEKLVEFAKAHETSDPLVALRALERAHRIAVETGPVDEWLAPLRARLDAPPDRVPSPFEEAVVSWDNLLHDKSSAVAQGWVSDRGLLRLDVPKDGRGVFPDGKPVVPGARFVYEAEFRVTKAYPGTRMFGLLFCSSPGMNLAALYEEAGFELSKLTPQGQEMVTSKARPNPDLDAWHRMSVHVDGDAVEVWFDRERILDADPERMGHLPPGECGLTVQFERVEVREVRIGELR
jgi:tetratricopeptide (TPR) repeat protein